MIMVQHLEAEHVCYLWGHALEPDHAEEAAGRLAKLSSSSTFHLTTETGKLTKLFEHGMSKLLKENA